MWILLEYGMKIDYGDECYDSSLDSWSNMNQSDVIGEEYNEEFHVPMRRKINTEEQNSNSLQRLKTEIAIIADSLEDYTITGADAGTVASIVCDLRQLSAV